MKYTYYDNKKEKDLGWFFEVQLSAETVRPVSGDEELEKKYGNKPLKK